MHFPAESYLCQRHSSLPWSSFVDKMTLSERSPFSSSLITAMSSVLDLLAFLKYSLVSLRACLSKTLTEHWFMMEKFRRCGAWEVSVTQGHPDSQDDPSLFQVYNSWQTFIVGLRSRSQCTGGLNQVPCCACGIFYISNPFARQSRSPWYSPDSQLVCTKPSELTSISAYVYSPVVSICHSDSSSMREEEEL